MTLIATPPPLNQPDVDVEAGVIEDARARQRRQRRRGMIGLLVLALVGAVAAIVAVATSGSSPRAAPAFATPGGLPTAALATLNVAGPLAVGPNGALYVADVARDRILVRLPDGRFRVVAGNGKVGFSGDGGPAVDAELSDVSDLAFSPAGALYVADGGRVRVIGRNGVIRTIAGDGRPLLQTIANDTPALSAPLGLPATGGVQGNPTPLWIAFSPISGQLYISTGRQILRLTTAGRLDTVRAIVPSGLGKGPLAGFGPIAIDTRGNIDAAVSGWWISQVAPNGIAHEVGSGRAAFARGSGGNYAVLQPGPGGAIYAAKPGIARIEPHKLVPIAAFNGPLSTINERRLRGQYFPPTYFAFSRNGRLYADDTPGNIGFEEHQQLLSISNGDVSLLWQEKNATPK